MVSPEENYGGWSEPCFFYAESGDLENLARWVASCGNVDYTGEDGYTPLTLAAEAGHLECVDLPLRNGADPNVVSPNEMPVLMHAAIRYGNGAVIERLLAGGGDINKTDSSGYGALHQLAADQRRFDGLQVALRYSPDLDVQNEDGETPLQYAVVWGCLDAARALLEAGADTEIADKPGGTPLVLAAASSNQVRPDMVALLLSHGADAGAVTNEGWNALMFAAAKGCAQSVRLLLPKTTDVDHEASKGATALSLAGDGGYAEIVRMLIEAGATR